MPRLLSDVRAGLVSHVPRALADRCDYPISVTFDLVAVWVMLGFAAAPAAIASFVPELGAAGPDR